MIILPSQYYQLPLPTNISKAVVDKLASGLLRDVKDARSRLQVLSDDMMMKWNQDVDLLNEIQRGYHYFTVFFDGESVCSFDTNEQPRDVELKIYLAIQGRFDEGSLAKDMTGYELMNEKKKAERKEIEDEINKIDLSGATKEEKLVSHAVAQALREGQKGKESKVKKLKK